MPTLSKEVIEFGQTGLKEIKAAVKDMKAEMTDTYKATEKLKTSMKDGTYARAARQYDNAKKALAGFRKEQEAIAKNFQKGRDSITNALQRNQIRTAYTQRYGRLGGAAAMAAMDYGRPIGRGLALAGRGIGSLAQSGLGVAAGLGAGVSIGALANRGFQGTAAAAKLDHELTRLARSISSDILPVMTALSSVLSRITGARENVRAGKGGIGDYATTLGFYGLLGGGISVGGIAATAFAKNQIVRAFPGASAAAASRFGTGAAAARGMGAAALGTAGRFAGPIGVAYAGYEGIQYARHYNPYENRFDDPKMREQLEKRRQATDKRNWFQRNFPNVSYAVGQSGGGPPGDRDQNKQDSRSWGVRQSDAFFEFSNRNLPGGNPFYGAFHSTRGPGGKNEPKKVDDGMRIVQGAGERRSSGDLYEELASGFAQKAFSPDDKEHGNGPASIFSDILEVGRRIAEKIGA